MVYYFAYGSNMDNEDLDIWCHSRGYSIVKFLDVTPAKLNNYKLSFNYYSKGRGGGAANIMESQNDCVYGLLIEIDQNDLKTIRIKEGCYEDRPSIYNEIDIGTERLIDHKLICNVKTYKVAKNYEKNQQQLPTKYYMTLIVKNAKKYNFPVEYIKYLEAIKTQ